MAQASGARLKATRTSFWPSDVIIVKVDRGSKATLSLTIPRLVFKSSVKDSAYRPKGIALQGSPPQSICYGRFHKRLEPLGCTSAALLWVGKRAEDTGSTF
ncbi:hypothetical protein AMTR_s00073p00192480 [Amborella trichopoda]|uniref:Uncharacterized protein n=1 Tax=Amborella trichopoda TaxID=13333 RepID=W1NNJ7_AMBTC|nr:hypothetical protein AMTR_s00073p00192480 [Amborella trichopoda]